MSWFEPLIIVAAVSFVGLVIFLSLYLKKKGKSLGGDCCSSKSCQNCHQKCINCEKIMEEYKKAHSNI